MKPYKKFKVGHFEEAYKNRQIVSTEIIEGRIYFSCSSGDKGQIYMANGNPKIWKSDEKAKYFIDRLDAGNKISDHKKERNEKNLQDAHDVMSEMIVDETGGYTVLALPNGDYGAFYNDLYEQSLFSIARGQFKDCFTVTGTIESVAASIKEHVQEIYSHYPGGFEKAFSEGEAMEIKGIVADALRRISAHAYAKKTPSNEKHIVFNNAYDALRAAQELLAGASKALSSGREDSANIRLLISGSASLSG